tara:strand:+ start:691 stop:1176 length:486 start_codon:yes stop_codon:yes gene_type:complete
MTDGNLPPGCTQDDIDAAGCGGCGVCAECCADEVAAAEAADRAAETLETTAGFYEVALSVQALMEAADRAAEEAEAVTLEGLIAHPATLEAFARYLLDELRYTPYMLCAALGDPAGYGEVFARWYAERRLAQWRDRQTAPEAPVDCDFENPCSCGLADIDW